MSKSNAYKGNSAVALKYNPEKDYSPVVVASGHGIIAEKIIDIADENGVPVYRDDSAAALLSMLDVGKSIPPELYHLVASIYVEILKTSDELKKNKMIL
ncbi:MAG TPA: EscU/YscU/HrcU family type III secretion system export apparatus switch protein [Oscillospiraceae bacterium]|nr:EscU/YscU/HrcU family type III secretion system export apparatus switch protein [Oscillospiraceae bacterium]